MAMSPLEARVARLEGAFEQVNERLAGIEQRLMRVEEAVFVGIPGRIDGLREDLTRRMDRQFFWMLSLILVSILIPIALRILDI